MLIAGESTKTHFEKLKDTVDKPRPSADGSLRRSTSTPNIAGEERAPQLPPVLPKIDRSVKPREV